MTAQSNTNLSISSATSISSKLDNVLSVVNSLNSRLSAIEAKIDALGSRFDAINNAIDSLENVLVNSINGIKEIILASINGRFDAINNAIDSLENVLVNSINGIKEIILASINGIFDLIKSLFGRENNDRTDEILSKLSKIEADIDNLFIHFDDSLNYASEAIKAAIARCCAELTRLINSLIKDKDNNEILDAIRQMEGRIKESIGGYENRIIGEINQNESKLDTIINKLGDKDADWVTRILAAISALASLLRDNKCDLNQVIIDNNSQIVNYLTTNNIDSSIENYLTNNNIYNNDYITNSVTNTVNNSVTNAVNNSVTNAVNNSVTNAVNNAVNTISSQIVNSTNSIINSNNQDDYVLIKVPIFLDCEDGQPKFDEEEISVKEGTEELEYLIFDKLAKIEAIKCTKVEPVAIIPEWWQLRLEGNVPQFVIAFGEVDQLTGKCLHAKYPMTIPHFKNVKPLSCPVPRYRKGNYELLGIMKDNSKLIINAFSEYECERVYDSIFPFLDPVFSSSMKYKIGKRVGYQFKEIWVCPRFGKYFSQGTKDTNPDWTVYF